MKLSARKVSNYDLFSSYAWYTPGVTGMLGLFLWFLAGGALSGAVTYLFRLFVPEPLWNSYGMLIVYPLQFIPAMIYASYRSRMNRVFETGYKLESGHVKPYSWPLISAITVMTAAGCMITADLPNYLNYRLTMLIPGMKTLYGVFQASMGMITGAPLWVSLIATAVFAPFFEEWLCRGIILRGLLTKMKPTWAIVISAAFFALIHMNPWQGINAFIIGCVMGYLYYKTGSLLLTMLMHFVNNATGVILSQTESLAQYDFFVDMLGVSAYTFVWIAGLAVLCLGLMLIGRIPTENKWGNMDSITL